MRAWLVDGREGSEFWFSVRSSAQNPDWFNHFSSCDEKGSQYYGTSKLWNLLFSLQWLSCTDDLQFVIAHCRICWCFDNLKACYSHCAILHQPSTFLIKKEEMGQWLRYVTWYFWDTIVSVCTRDKVIYWTTWHPIEHTTLIWCAWPYESFSLSSFLQRMNAVIPVVIECIVCHHIQSPFGSWRTLKPLVGLDCKVLRSPLS